MNRLLVVAHRSVSIGAGWLLCVSALLLPVDAEITVKTGTVAPLPITAHTGMKPQSKLWKHGGHWWGVFSDGKGTHIWKMGSDRWIRSATLTSSGDVRADVLSTGQVVNILLFRGETSSLVKYAWVEVEDVYGRIADISEARYPMAVDLDPGVETATMAVDGDGRTWIASDGETAINVRWKQSADGAFSDPITLVEGVSEDDICVITRLGDGSVGVLWSNQNRRRYGFRRHVPASEPEQWLPDEVPAAASAIDHGDGMSDDHLNVAVASDGTLYATVKTSYDTEGMPLVACLVRRPDGQWDGLYNVDDEGSRGVMVLDESRRTILSIYTSYRDDAIVLRSSGTDVIAFSDRITLLERPEINNVSAPREPVSGPFPIVASQGDSLMHTILLELK